MSMDYNVFLNDLDDSKIPLWMEELNKLGMECEIHPEFSFKTQTGFLPFKVKVTEKSNEELMSNEYLTGFEYYLDSFNLEEHIEPQKQSFFDKLLKKPIEQNYFCSKEIDEKLKLYKYVVTFNFGIADTFELRMASLASATLSRITNGLCCYPGDDIWYDNETIVENALKDVADHERSLNPREFRLHEFEEWL